MRIWLSLLVPTTPTKKRGEKKKVFLSLRCWTTASVCEKKGGSKVLAEKHPLLPFHHPPPSSCALFKHVFKHTSFGLVSWMAHLRV